MLTLMWEDAECFVRRGELSEGILVDDEDGSLTALFGVVVSGYPSGIDYPLVWCRRCAYPVLREACMW